MHSSGANSGAARTSVVQRRRCAASAALQTSAATSVARKNALEQARATLVELEQRCQEEIAALEARGSDSVALEELRIPARKADLEVEPLVLVWTPWRVAADGSAEPAWTPIRS